MLEYMKLPNTEGDDKKAGRVLIIEGFDQCMRYLNQFGSTISAIKLSAFKLDSNMFTQLFTLFHSQCGKDVHTITLSSFKGINITSELQPCPRLWRVSLEGCNLADTFRNLAACFQFLQELIIEGNIGEDVRRDYLNFRFPYMSTLELELGKFKPVGQYIVAQFLTLNQESLQKVVIKKKNVLPTRL